MVGLTGTSGTWDYEFAYNHSASNVSDRDHQGYLNEALIRNGFADGDDHRPSSALGSAGLALYEQAQIRGEVRAANGTTDSVDFKASHSLARLDGGDLALALGGESRREKQVYRQSGRPGAGPDPGRDLARAGRRIYRSRRVNAVFARSAPHSPSSWSCRPRCATSTTRSAAAPSAPSSACVTSPAACSCCARRRAEASGRRACRTCTAPSAPAPPRRWWTRSAWASTRRTP